MTVRGEQAVEFQLLALSTNSLAAMGAEMKLDRTPREELVQMCAAFRNDAAAVCMVSDLVWGTLIRRDLA